MVVGAAVDVVAALGSGVVEPPGAVLLPLLVDELELWSDVCVEVSCGTEVESLGGVAVAVVPESAEAVDVLELVPLVDVLFWVV